MTTYAGKVASTKKHGGHAQPKNEQVPAIDTKTALLLMNNEVPSGVSEPEFVGLLKKFERFHMYRGDNTAAYDLDQQKPEYVRSMGNILLQSHNGLYEMAPKRTEFTGPEAADQFNKALDGFLEGPGKFMGDAVSVTGRGPRGK